MGIVSDAGGYGTVSLSRIFLKIPVLHGLIFVPFNGSQFYDVAAYIYTGSNAWQFFPLFDPLFVISSWATMSMTR